MTLSRQALEDAVAKFHAQALADDALAAELVQSRAEFFPSAASASEGPEALPEPARSLAARRHLEWFLFERPSEALGGVPVEVWLNAEPEALAHTAALLTSLAGVFEVTGVEHERGLWLRDLFGLGEYPVEEAEASVAVLPGDVLVGRVFPAGDAAFRLSPAATVFRNGALLEALKRDAERLRTSRRGSIRIAQIELERMFLAPGGPIRDERTPVADSVDPARVERELRELLADGGAEGGFVDRLLGELKEAAAVGRAYALTEALNCVAFDTAADLARAQECLLALWTALQAPGGDAPPEADAPAPPDAVAEALARFDAGRHAGNDLEQLFRSLETDLGLDPGPDPADDVAPDFPGVVAAVIQEFLWETGREHGEAAARRYAPLVHLGEFATRVGVFENLAARDLLEFSARWVLDRGLLANADDALALLESLAAFCRWCEERQDLSLWTGFEPIHARLLASLPRLVELRRRHRAPVLESGAVYRFERARDGRATLIDLTGEVHEVELDDVLVGLLRNGDLVHAEIVDGGRAAVGACYPPELLVLAS
jgi:hypothetical protein